MGQWFSFYPFDGTKLKIPSRLPNLYPCIFAIKTYSKKKPFFMEQSMKFEKNKANGVSLCFRLHLNSEISKKVGKIYVPKYLKKCVKFYECVVKSV